MSCSANNGGCDKNATSTDLGGGMAASNCDAGYDAPLSDTCEWYGDN